METCRDLTKRKLLQNTVMHRYRYGDEVMMCHLHHWLNLTIVTHGLIPGIEMKSPSLIPLTESLKETVERMVPYWEGEIRESLKKNNQVLVAAHGNSLRAVIKYLKNISDEDIVSLNLPTGIPYVFEFDDNLNLQKDYFLGDPEEIKKLMEAVANQGKAK